MLVPSRKTFIIDENFTISKIFDKVDVTTHSGDIIQILKEDIKDTEK